MKLKLNRPILSICTRCRDGHEAEYDSTRGGTRLATSVLTRAKKSLDQPFDLRGVACMSQCKRPCISAVSASGCFSYIFGGGLDFRKHFPEHFPKQRASSGSDEREVLFRQPETLYVARQGHYQRST